jgi:hypothetical protein
MDIETMKKANSLHAEMVETKQKLDGLRDPQRKTISAGGFSFTKDDPRPGVATAVKACFRIMEMALADEDERIQKEFNELMPLKKTQG